MKFNRALMLGCLTILAGSALSPAAAWPEERERSDRRSRQVARPASSVPPAAIITGYLPRNNAVPLYNKPPRRRPGL